MLQRLFRMAAGMFIPAAIAFTGVAAVAQDGSIGIRLVDAPVDRADDPRAHIYIVDHVEPGAILNRTIEVANKTSDPQRIRLYAGAATIDGGDFRGEPGDASNDLTGWISLDPAVVEVPPGSTARSDATITVPLTAGGGERYAVIWAEPPAGGSDVVEIVNRVGIRVYLSVGGGAEPPSDFDIHSLTASRDTDGAPRVQAQVENTGERALDLSGELSLSDGPGGLSAGPFRTDGVTTLAPGEAGEMFVLLDPALPPGPWLARMTAVSGRTEKAVEATIVFPDTAGESAEPVAATEVPLHRNRGVLVPLAIGLIALMLMLLLVFWWFVWRRRDDDDEEGSAPRRGARKVASRS